VTVEFRNVRFTDLEVRNLDGPEISGTFDGYANLHGVTDSYGTRFAAGAWTVGTPDLDQPTALLWMHDATNPVGVFTAEDDVKGLRIRGVFDQTDEGQRARARAQSGSAPELSVGFVRLRNREDDDTEIISARLVEVSLITARMASQPGAVLTSVRAAEAEAEAQVIQLHERQRRLKGLGMRLRLGGIDLKR